jgi:hypothetical protein
MCWQWWGFIMWCELGHCIVWYKHGYECFEGVFWFCLHRPSDEGSSRSKPNCVCWPFRLHCPITEKATVSNLNITHFSCIVSLCYKNLHTHVRQYTALLFYIILLSEQQCVAGNIITNSTVYCVMNVWSCFVMVWNYIFLVPLRKAGGGEVWLWHGGWLPYRCCAT